MSWKVGLSPPWEGLCEPCEEESGFLCQLFRDSPFSIDHCGRRRYIPSSCLQTHAAGVPFFCYLNSSTIVKIQFHAISSAHWPVSHLLGEDTAVLEWHSGNSLLWSCFEMAKGDNLKRNDFKSANSKTSVILVSLKVLCHLLWLVWEESVKEKIVVWPT